MTTIKALFIDRVDGEIVSAIREVDARGLPPGDVTVRITHSSLNYKDGLVLKGLGGLVKSYPHIPGIDFAGTVISSSSERFSVGDVVILTGWRVGEVRWGGYASLMTVDSRWLVACPAGLTPLQAMAVGTAGLTAMMCVEALERHGVAQAEGEILVTGAAGGVGSMAIALLASLGHSVTALSGRLELEDYLIGLGATRVISRQAFVSGSSKPLLSETWAGVVDTVGGNILATALAQLRYGGGVAACGLAGGAELRTTVLPFILRGAVLYGIDSVQAPSARRSRSWERLTQVLDLGKLAKMTTVIGLEDVAGVADAILAGQVRGRTVVEIR